MLRVFWCTFVFPLAASLITLSASGDALERQSKRLEQRLLAPCCYQQTLDVHSSELTSTLRAEIASRLAAGESGAAIEAAFVERYGARIRAVPPSSPLEVISLIVIALILITGALLWWRARTWVQREPAPLISDAQGDHYDEHIDRMLKEADG